jgi:hypothetical protein
MGLPTGLLVNGFSHILFTILISGIHSVEIPTRCSFVIEFIIQKFIEGLTCFERHTSHH